MANTFKTSDLYQTAFITHQTKRDPDLELQSGRVIFSFPADAPTMEALNQFNQDCEIGAFSFANSIKQMRTIMIRRSREDQIRFWSAVKLPIAALIDSGGKSIHAWLQVSKLARVDTSADWTTHIEGRLYDQGLIPLGVDSACSNPARLSRLPGHFREENKKYQRILWLNTPGAEKGAW